MDRKTNELTDIHMNEHTERPMDRQVYYGGSYKTSIIINIRSHYSDKQSTSTMQAG